MTPQTTLHPPSLAPCHDSCPHPPAGALEYIQSLPAWKGSSLLELLATWVERMGDPRVQGLFTTRTAGELLWGYE